MIFTTMNETSEYLLEGSGKLFRAGVLIGKVKGTGEVSWSDPKFARFKGAVTRWLKEEEARKAAALAEADVPADSAVVAGPEEETAVASGELGELQAMAEQARVEGARYLAEVRDDLAFAKEHKLPEPPKKNPMYGDKTPAYVEWLREYRPEKWRRKFGVKGKAKVPVVKLDAETGFEKVTGYREAEMAMRKTHLTERIESDPTIGADQSWEA